MRQTNSLSVLPAMQRVWVRAFWAVLSAFVGLGLVAATCLGREIGILPLTATLIFLLSGWLDRRVAALSYRIWNWTAGVVFSAMECCLVWVCFVLVTIVGRAGTTLRLGRPASDESMWEPRQQDEAIVQQREVGGSDAGWLAVAREAASRNDRWLVVLLPFLMLLAVLAPESLEEKPAGVTYSLY